MALLCVLLVTWWDRTPPWRRRLAARALTLFGISYPSHLGDDMLDTALTGQYGDLTFVLWPFVPTPHYSTSSVFPIVRVYYAYQQSMRSSHLVLLGAAGLLFCLLQLRTALSTGRYS